MTTKEMTEDHPMGIQMPRFSDKRLARWFRSMGEAGEDITLSAEFLLDLAKRIDRLRRELAAAKEREQKTWDALLHVGNLIEVGCAECEEIAEMIAARKEPDDAE